MESVSLKLSEEMLEDIDSKLKKNNFSTRTEFIRTAIRDKLKGMSRDELIKKFMGFYGSAERKVSDKELRIARENVFKEILKERGLD